MHNGDIPNNLVIDHINNIKFDNRIENLQLLTAYQNTIKDMKRPNPTKYKGVRKKRNKYQAFYYNGEKEIYIGSYPTEEIANQARLDFIKALHTKNNGSFE